MSTELTSRPRTTFSVPPELFADSPPEARGLRRDAVRLLVATPAGIEHMRFRNLHRVLEPGDLLVVNTSATLPAALDGSRSSGEPTVVHFSAPLDDTTWVIELRLPDGSGPNLDGVAGEKVALGGGGSVELLGGHPDVHVPVGNRLWRAHIEAPVGVEEYLLRFGRPITYGYVRRRWPLSAYQTIFARECGSAEMPSAGRPFSHRLVARLVAEGVGFAPLTLHGAVSSPEAGEPPQAERFDVPVNTARLVNQTRAAGGRVIAVGTTAVRALESVARVDGTVTAGSGWTDLVLAPERPARVTDGLITGWHVPEASHLLLLEAVAPDLVQDAYTAALEARYLWHEFGDACLLLPGRPREGRHGSSVPRAFDQGF